MAGVDWVVWYIALVFNGIPFVFIIVSACLSVRLYWTGSENRLRSVQFILLSLWQPAWTLYKFVSPRYLLVLYIYTGSRYFRGGGGGGFRGELHVPNNIMQFFLAPRRHHP